MAETPLVSPTPAVIRRLAYAADLRRTANQLLSQHREGAHAQAIVLFDACMESLVRTALDALNRTPKGSPPGSELYIGSLLTALDRACGAKSLFGDGQVVEAEILRFHDVRNNIQHSGVNPSEEAILEQVAAFESNAARLIRFTFGLHWSDVSVGLLIENLLVRELFQLAEKAQSENRVEDAIVAFVAAFEVARFAEQHEIIGSMITWAQAGADNPMVRGERYHGQIVDYVVKVHEETEVLKLRLDYKKYRRFADVASEDKINPAFSLFWPFGGSTADDVLTYWRSELKETITNVRGARGSEPETFEGFVAWVGFAHQFVSDAILNWQATKRPFPISA